MLRDQHAEAQWQNTQSSREIMKEARVRFRKNWDFVALASTHYSQVKRYPRTSFWFWWHTAAAVLGAAIGYLTRENADQLDVITRIASSLPLRLTKLWCRRVIRRALGFEKMVPHTRALLLDTLGNLERALGNKPDSGVVREIYEEIHRLRREVMEEEDQMMAERQWCRLAFSLGFYYLDLASHFDVGNDHGYNAQVIHEKGAFSIQEAFHLAEKVAPSQLNKIRSGLRKRGFDENDFLS